VTLQTGGKSFKQHVKERASASLRAIIIIENLRLLSLETTMKLFCENNSDINIQSGTDVGSLDGKRPHDTRECEGDIL
jgi:hypothetical protein